jgi:hypothetical protein
MSDFNPKDFNKYGMNRNHLADTEPSKAAAGWVAILVLVFVVGAFALFFTGPSKDYTVEHDNLARSPSSSSGASSIDVPGSGATTPLPTPLPNAGRPTPLQNPPLATPSEPQK